MEEPQIPKAAELGRLLIDESRRLAKAGEILFAERCGISVSEKDLLFHLKMSGGQMRMSDVSRGLTFTDGGATKLIGRMVNAGYVTRGKSAEDRRVVLVTITEAGEAKLEEVLPVLMELVSTFFDRLSDADIRTAVTILRKLDPEC